MKRNRVFLLLVLCLSLVQAALAQTATATPSALPRLVRFGGTVKGPDGSPLPGVAGITFALYSEQTGGAPLWLETQNVTADINGRYMALLGATKPDGLPAELFTSEQARWVGVQVQGQPDQPRVLLVSAPYALKAGDAETIGGLPPSAFMLATPSTGSAAPPLVTPPAAAASPATSAGLTGSGTADYIPLWTTASNLGSSVLFQSGTGATAEVGINTATPASTLDVNGGATVRGPLTLPATGTATATAGDNSQPLNLTASVFSSSSSAAIAKTFQLQANPANNGTEAPSATLNLLYGSGAGTPAETGLAIASNGKIAFATGQAFPGVAQLAAANTFTASQTVNGSVSVSGQFVSTAATGTAPLQVASTTQVADLNASLLGGLAASSFQPAGSYATLGANTFSGNQSVTGNLATSGAITTGSGSTFSGLTLPAQSAATASQGQNSHSLNLTASSYNSGTSAAVNQNFKWQAEPTGNDTSTPGASLHLLFSSGSNSAAETGLKLASNGQITFAAGQTFPGTTPAGVVGVNPLQVALLKWFPAYQSATFPTGIGPHGIAFDGANIWVTNFDGNTVTELLAATGAVLGTFPVGTEPEGVAFDGANIWVVNAGSNSVTKLLAATGALVNTFSVGSNPQGIAFDGANIWVANTNSNNVTKLLATTGGPVGTFTVGSNPNSVAFDGANIWVTNYVSNSVTKLLAATGAVVGAFPVGSGPSGVAFDGANIWVANAASNTVTKLLAATGALVGTFPVGSDPDCVAFDGANIWVTNYLGGTVTKLLAATGALVGTFTVGNSPQGVAFDGANIWVANGGSDSLSKL